MTRIAIILLVLVLLASCSPTQTVVVVTHSPNPVTNSDSSVSDTAYIDNITLTSEQNNKLFALFEATLNMCGDWGDPTFFKDSSAFSVDDLLSFAYTVINDTNLIDEDYIDTETVNSEMIQNIIRSAFGIDYTPQKGDSYGELLQYNGDSFNFEGSDPQLLFTHTYSVERLSSGNLLIKYHVLADDRPLEGYICKGEAVLQEDDESLFGYRLVSMSICEDADIVFTGAEASTNMSPTGVESAIDGNDNTAWVAGGNEDWIKLSFDEPQNVSGLILHFGNWSSEDAFNESCLPASCLIEFSDGTSVIDEDCQSLEIGDDTCFFFDEVKNTSYIKVTITSVAEGSGSDMGVYVSEIKPI